MSCNGNGRVIVNWLDTKKDEFGQLVAVPKTKTVNCPGCNNCKKRIT